MKNKKDKWERYLQLILEAKVTVPNTQTGSKNR